MIGCANGFEKWISGSDRDLFPGGTDFCWQIRYEIIIAVFCSIIS